MRLPYIIIGLTFLLLSCTDNEEPKVKPVTQEPAMQQQQQVAVELDNSPLSVEIVAGKYNGNLPCADCEAIKYILYLNADGTYTEQATYVGKSTEVFETVGLFEITTDNKIKLTKLKPGMEFLAKSKDGRLMLDISGNAISGALAHKYQLLPYSAETSGIKDKNTRLWEEGIEFYAQGNEPGWHLTLDYNKAIVFGIMGKPDKTFPIVEPEYNEEAKTLTYTILTEQQGLKFTIDLSGQCTDNMSGQVFDATVSVAYREGNSSDYTNYEGCGNFTINPELLAHTWQLVSMDDIPADPGKFSNGIPEITFRMFDRGFGGMDGCNEIGGGYNMQADRIQFSSFASTAKSCPQMDASRDFNFALQQSMFSYVVYDELLTLTNLRHTLIFSKKK